MKQSKVKAVSKVNTAPKFILWTFGRFNRLKKTANIPAEKSKPIPESPQDRIRRFMDKIEARESPQDETERTTIAGTTRDGCSYEIKGRCLPDLPGKPGLCRQLTYSATLLKPNGSGFFGENETLIFINEGDGGRLPQELFETMRSPSILVDISDINLKLESIFPYSEFFREALKTHGWKDVEDFVYRRLFPFFYVRGAAEIKTKNVQFFKKYVHPLRMLFSDIPKILDGQEEPPLPPCHEWFYKEIYNLLEAFEKHDVDFIRKLMKQWKDTATFNTKCPPALIYEIFFPKGRAMLEPPVLLSPKEIRYELEKQYGVPLSSPAVYKLCKKMHLTVNSKAGRPKKQNGIKNH